MARLRTIKPEFWVSEQIAECSTSARLTFIGIWNFSDDQGVHPAKPKTLKAELYPMDDVTVSDVQGWVDELLQAGLLAKFTATDGEDYWFVTGWERHQKIDRPTFKHPAPPPDSTMARRALDEVSTMPRSGVETNRVETKGVESSEEPGAVAPSHTRKAPAKTSLPVGFSVSDRVKAWAVEKGFDSLDDHLEAFMVKAQAKGYQYADWDSAFMEAIRKDWAGIRAKQGQESSYGGANSAKSMATTPDWVTAAGFSSVWAAESAGCTARNHHRFANGMKRETA